MEWIFHLFSSVFTGLLYMYVLSCIVPRFKREEGYKKSFTLFFFVIFFFLFDGREIKHTLALYFSVMLILRGVYKNSTFVSSMASLFLFVINLLSLMIASNISTMLFQHALDFRVIVSGVTFSSLLLYGGIVFVMTQYYRHAIKIFKKITHLSRKLERVLVLCNVLVFSLIIAYHRMAFSNLINIQKSGVFDLTNGKEVCFYTLSSYLFLTALSFLVVVLINRLFIVDYSMENYKFKAETDLMTGTLSREAGLNHLKMEMAQSLANDYELTIAYVDVNDLKKVNDVQGHKAGDLMLRTVTTIISENLRNRDEITRLGGDEFLVLFKKCNVEQAAKVWMRINEIFALVNRSRQYPFSLSVSVGFVQYDSNKHRDMMHLLNEADEKMYAYKKRFKEKTL